MCMLFGHSIVLRYMVHWKFESVIEPLEAVFLPR